MHRWMICVAAGLAMLACAGASGEEDRAEALIRQARKTAMELKAVDATVSFKHESRGKTATSEGVLRMLKPAYLLLALHGRATGDMFRLSDGKTLYTVSPEKKRYSTVPVTADREPLFGLTARYSLEALFLAPEKFPGDEAGAPHYAGKENVDGRVYDVVRLTNNDASQIRTLYFGASGLPEGVKLQGTIGGLTERREIWLTSVKVNPSFEAAQFSYTPPDDYRKVGGE